jgi:hypothetical protein
MSVAMMPMFSSAGAAAGSAKRPREFITAPAVPATP